MNGPLGVAFRSCICYSRRPTNSEVEPMDIIKLNATPRAERGKGASRRLRRSDQIPAVAYGRELPATTIAVSCPRLCSGC